MEKNIYRFHSYRAYWLILFLLFLQFTILPASHAQEKYFAGNYRVENFGKKEGMPETVVINVMQDRKGFIWITTAYYLVRYDGYTFKNYSLQKAFPSEIIHTFQGLVEDKDGLIWFTSIQHGVIVFDPKQEVFSRYTAGNGPENLPQGGVTVITLDNDNNVWIGTPGGLALATKQSGRINFKRYGVKRTDKIISTVEEIIAGKKMLAGKTKVGNNETISENLHISSTNPVFIVCEGEALKGIADFGWIQNSKGDTVWKFADQQSIFAGGDDKNKLQLDTVSLSPGDYTVHYISDDSHAWSAWNATPPFKEDWWGIQVFEIEPGNRLFKSIDELKKGVPFGESIKGLVPDGKSLFALTNAGIEKLQFNSRDSTLSTELTKIPAAVQIQSVFRRLDQERLIGSYIYQDESGNFRTGLYQFNTRSKTYKPWAASLSKMDPFLLTGLVVDHRDSVWLVTNSDFSAATGLYLANLKEGDPVFHRLNIIPPSNMAATGASAMDQIWSMIKDRAGAIWIASRGYGLYKIHPEKLPVTLIHANLHADTLKRRNWGSLIADKAGNIWRTGSKNEVSQYNRGSGKISHFSFSKGTGFLFGDRDGAIIISEPYQTKKYNYSENRFDILDVQPPAPFIFFGTDSANRFLLAKDTRTFKIADSGKTYDLNFDSSFRTFSFYRNIHIGRNGHFWISTAFEGADLYRWDEQLKKLVFIKKFLRMGDDVAEIYEDKNDIVWLGTYANGLVRIDFKNDSTRYFTIEDGLPSNFITKILAFDDELFICTDVGSFYIEKNTGRVRRNRVLDEWIVKTTQLSFSNSFVDFGGPESIIRSGPSELAMATADGFAFINTEDLYTDTSAIPLQIASLTIGDLQFRSVDSAAGQMKFRYSQNDLIIEYLGIYYGMNAGLRYAFMLEGSNTDWVDAGTDRIARYSNLQPGEYTFYLKVAQDQLNWSEGQKMFSFVIQPPWWKTWWAYTLYTLIALGLIWWYVLFRSRMLRERNAELESRVTERTAQLNKSLHELKTTQAQLVQSEKMASLGELTAGIAHEIQNPLNFVNNFSEINRELIAELREESEKGNLDQVKAIASDLDANEEKINLHGKRADAIVKSMMQHSRSSGSTKEPTDINALADEYLRLAYHGLRAKEKSFNASFETDLDPRVGKIAVMPQEIGRVLLNLFNNAFYAVGERQKRNEPGYQPKVILQTVRKDNELRITVKDNGTGIPAEVVDKIFQPFFTTKPTGQGTGLGLSLSYDVIKAHNGELNVKSTVGVGSEFVIVLEG